MEETFGGRGKMGIFVVDWSQSLSILFAKVIQRTCLRVRLNLKVHSTVKTMGENPSFAIH